MFHRKSSGVCSIRLSVFRLSIESVFLAMVREHNIEEEDSGGSRNVKKRHWWSRSG